MSEPNQDPGLRALEAPKEKVLASKDLLKSVLKIKEVERRDNSLKKLREQFSHAMSCLRSPLPMKLVKGKISRKRSVARINCLADVAERAIEQINEVLYTSIKLG
jgi:hypothetical protein